MDYMEQVAVADIKYAKIMSSFTKCWLVLVHKYRVPSEDYIHYSVEMVNQNSFLEIIPFRGFTPKIILLRITINI